MIGSGRCARRLALFAATWLVGVSPAGAQWRAELQAGRLQYDAAPDAVTTSLAGGLSWSTASSAAAVSVGVPFTGEEPIWGAIQGNRRVALGGSSAGVVAFGLDLGGDGFGYHLSTPDTSRLVPLLIGSDAAPITGWGAAGEIMPFVGFDGNRFDVEARAGVVSFISDGTRIDALHRTAFVADAYVQPSPWNRLTVRADARWVSAVEGGFPFAGVTLLWDGPFAIWGSVGRWFDDAVEATSWRAGASLPLGSRIALVVNGEHEEIDPVYATPGRTTWGAGVRVRLGTLPEDIPEPVPAAYVDGIATVRVDDDDIDGVPRIAGDFNDWTPEPMTRDPGSDSWLFRTPLEPGVYHFAFVDAAGNWFVPEETPGRRSDGMGGYVAVLVVEAER